MDSINLENVPTNVIVIEDGIEICKVQAKKISDALKFLGVDSLYDIKELTLIFDMSKIDKQEEHKEEIKQDILIEIPKWLENKIYEPDKPIEDEIKENNVKIITPNMNNFVSQDKRRRCHYCRQLKQEEEFKGSVGSKIHTKKTKFTNCVRCRQKCLEARKKSFINE